METFWGTVGYPLVVITLVGLSGLGASLMLAARGKTKNLQLLQLLELVEHFGQLVVLEIDQTLVQPIKHASDDGKLTPQEIDEIKGKAIARFKELMGTTRMDALQKHFGSTMQLINTQIEAEVAKLRAIQSGRRTS